jgi:putative addiction module component (TIGR02574 family)
MKQGRRKPPLIFALADCVLIRNNVPVSWYLKGFIMQITLEQIAEGALALPSEARALLADRLVESLDPAEDGYIKQLWAKESQRRIAQVRSGAVATISGEDVFAQVRAAIRR